MGNSSPKTEHLLATRWQPGQSGNLAGKPKGTKNLSTHIRELLENQTIIHKPVNGEDFRGTPMEAIIRTLIIRAVNGDLRAFDLLGKYGYGTKVDVGWEFSTSTHMSRTDTSKYIKRS